MSSNEIDELIRRKSLLGSQLAGKDKDYVNYAGGSFEISSKIAMIDFLLGEPFVSDKLKKTLKLYNRYLDKQRKAFFSTVDSDTLTKLAILVGSNRNVISGRKPISSTE